MNVLEEANKIVSGDRNKDYGDAAVDMARVAKMWSVILDYEIRPEQVPLCMICVKLSRESHKHKRDNLVDIPGYSEVCSQVHEAYNRENLTFKNVIDDVIRDHESETIPNCSCGGCKEP